MAEELEALLIEIRNGRAEPVGPCSARARAALLRFGSNMPVRGVSSAGRAPALQAGGHRFDPGTLHRLVMRNLSRAALTFDGRCQALVRIASGRECRRGD
jgi:hypothetical protein